LKLSAGVLIVAGGWGGRRPAAGRPMGTKDRRAGPRKLGHLKALAVWRTLPTPPGFVSTIAEIGVMAAMAGKPIGHPSPGQRVPVRSDAPLRRVAMY